MENTTAEDLALCLINFSSTTDHDAFSCTDLCCCSFTYSGIWFNSRSTSTETFIYARDAQPAARRPDLAPKELYPALGAG